MLNVYTALIILVCLWEGVLWYGAIKAGRRADVGEDKISQIIAPTQEQTK